VNLAWEMLCQLGVEAAACAVEIEIQAPVRKEGCIFLFFFWGGVCKGLNYQEG